MSTLSSMVMAKVSRPISSDIFMTCSQEGMGAAKMAKVPPKEGSLLKAMNISINISPILAR